MRVLLALASIAMLASAESPTGYSHRSSNSDLNFQPVPSVAQIHIPPSSQTHSRQYVMPKSFSTLEKQYAGPQVVYSPSHSHYSSPTSRSGSSQHTSSSNQLSQYSPAPEQYSSSASQQSQQYSVPNQQQQQQQPQQQLFSASSASQNYAAPQQQQQQQSYSQSSQSQSYAAPNQQQQQQPQQYSIPSNVQVSYGSPPQLPPGALGYGPPPVVTGAGPDHNVEYRVVYVKGPKAPKPDLILPPPPPQQKTLVYILVPRVEPPEPIIVPTHPPTPPSKPEVFFIRYKAPKKARQQQSYSVPSGSYGSPIGAASNTESVTVEAPTKSDSSKVLVRKSISSSSESSYGDKVTSSES